MDNRFQKNKHLLFCSVVWPREGCYMMYFLNIKHSCLLISSINDVSRNKVIKLYKSQYSNSGLKDNEVCPKLQCLQIHIFKLCKTFLQRTLGKMALCKQHENLRYADDQL